MSSSILLPGTSPAPARGLLVGCLDCRKDFRSSELQGQRCIGCRAHRACADVCRELDAFLAKQRRYRAAGAIANTEQFERLRRRLFTRIQGVVGNPMLAVELAQKEYRAVLSPHGLLGEKELLQVVRAKDFITR